MPWLRSTWSSRTDSSDASSELPAGKARVGLLGLSFRAQTDDLRGSPALYVARRLLDADHVVSAFDPAVRKDRAELAAPGIRMTDNAEDVFDDAAAVVVATEWPEFALIDLVAVRSRVARALIFDGRGIIDPELAVRAGFSYRGIGRPPREASAVAGITRPGPVSHDGQVDGDPTAQPTHPAGGLAAPKT